MFRRYGGSIEYTTKPIFRIRKTVTLNAVRTWDEFMRYVGPLHIPYTGVIALTRVPYLEELNLASTMITDLGLFHLKGMKLKALNFKQKSADTADQ